MAVSLLTSVKVPGSVPLTKIRWADLWSSSNSSMKRRNSPFLSLRCRGVDPLLPVQHAEIKILLLIYFLAFLSQIHVTAGVKTLDPNILHFHVLSSLPTRGVKALRGGKSHDTMLSAELLWYNNIAIIEHHGRYKAISAEFKWSCAEIWVLKNSLFKKRQKRK